MNIVEQQHEAADLWSSQLQHTNDDRVARHHAPLVSRWCTHKPWVIYLQILPFDENV